MAGHGVDGFTWAGIVARDYDEAHPLCLRTIEAARVAIEAAPVGDLVKAFGVCEPAGLGPNAPSDLFMYVLESLPQLDYPMQIGSLPAWPVNATCAMLTKADATDPNALISAAADVVHMLMGSGVPHATGKGASSCIPTADEGPGGIPGDGPGGISAWSFQSCTETLHQFSSRINQNAYQGIRNFKFEKETWVDPLCARLFNNTVKPDVMRLAREFGGYKISDNSEGVTNLIWSNGGMDPWHGGGFYPGDKPGAAGMEGENARAAWIQPLCLDSPRCPPRGLAQRQLWRPRRADGRSRVGDGYYCRLDQGGWGADSFLICSVLYGETVRREM